jgi:hypothetical protein
MANVMDPSESAGHPMGMKIYIIVPMIRPVPTVIFFPPRREF